MRSIQVKGFEAIFKKCEGFTNLSNVELAVPRTEQRQTMQSNADYGFPKEYHRRYIFIPLLDGLLLEIQGRFPK